MTLYVESSALLCWLFDQPRGEDARRAIIAANVVTCSALTLFECDRAIRRAVHAGLLDESGADRCHSILARASARWRVAGIDGEVLSRGRRPFPREPVRSLDAIHLATALFLRPELPELKVLTLDDRVADNARLLGFPVEPAQSR